MRGTRSCYFRALGSDGRLAFSIPNCRVLAEGTRRPFG